MNPKPRGIQLPVPQTPQIIRAFREQLNNDPVADDDNQKHVPFDIGILEDAENQYLSQEEELRMLKEKYSLLEEAFEKLKDEKQALQLQLVSQQNQFDEAFRHCEAQAEKQLVENRTQLHEMMLESQQWKLKMDSATREVELLQDQVVTIKAQKSESSKVVVELEARIAADEKHRKKTEMYLNRQRSLMEEVKKKHVRIQEAGKTLGDMVNSQKAQMQRLNLICRALEKQKDADDARIHELEQQLIECRKSNVQLEQKVQVQALREEETQKHLEKLLHEKNDFSAEIQRLIQALSIPNDIENNNLEQACEEMQHVVTRSTSNNK